MLRVRRYPEQKPKRPLKPKMGPHFSANWHERTDQALAIFWQRWRSAQFLGETEEIGRSLKPTHWGKTSRIQYYAISPEWVILVTNPVSGAPKLLSVWPRAWFEAHWRAAVHHSAAQAAREAQRDQKDAARRARMASAEPQVVQDA